MNASLAAWTPILQTYGHLPVRALGAVLGATARKQLCRTVLTRAASAAEAEVGQ
jgi:hypothetical protein